MSAATAAADPAWYWMTRPPSLTGSRSGTPDEHIAPPMP